MSVPFQTLQTEDTLLGVLNNIKTRWFIFELPLTTVYVLTVFCSNLTQKLKKQHAMVSVVGLRVIDNNIRTHPNRKIKIEFNNFVGFISECNIYVGPRKKMT